MRECLREVAKQAGVSVATVSRYINRNAPVSEEVAQRLDRVMTELRYSPHAAARHLASRKGEEDLPSWAIQLQPSELECELWRNRKVRIFDVDLEKFVNTLQGT